MSDAKQQWWEEGEAIPSSETVPSKQFPGNINERRYLRSSYNAGGFNRVVPEVTGNEEFGYYGILEPLGDPEEYNIKVEDLFRIEEARNRAVLCVVALEALRGKPVYRVDSESAIPLRPDLTEGPLDGDKALDLFKGEKKRHEEAKNGFPSYSNAHGSFWMDEPLKVAGAIAGMDLIGRPCVHLVYETELHESYIESAHVLVEFLDELEMLVKRDGCAYVHWSG